ncbi:hypothetical protein AAFF_G00345490 [Aldrovandia affinis]|uniref:Uncharacterized protein n=1 Tax=Aldrovandia affinis TaxID=143900 RepID=A0AAD7R5M2_9TELE|nr:hypothetical protein AAFF_G00345490 [Aldrovandia affinis]
MPRARGGGPVCRELQVIGAAEWRTQQEQDSDLQPVLQWVETGQRPPWGEVAGGTTATKGLWADFAALRRDCLLFKTRPSQRPHRETVFWPPPGPDVHASFEECTVVHQQTGAPPPVSGPSESLTVSPVRDSHRTPRTLSVPEQQQQQVDLTGATRPRRRRRPPGRSEDFV